MKQSLIYLICAVGFLLITGFPLFLADGCQQRRQQSPADTIIMRDTLRDTITVTVRDTVPRLVSVRVIGSVDIPLPTPSESDSARADSIPLPASVPVQCPAAVPPVSRSLSLPVVQKSYTDSDSTYTAYVSGIAYHDYPRLDSIRLRRQTAVERIRETVTVRQRTSRFSIGLQAGYGLTPAGFQPYIGLGVGYRVWP